MNTAELKDPLLEELNGALARSGNPEEIDKPGEQPEPLDKQLEVGPASQAKLPLPRATQLDKTYSKAAGGFGYKVIVEGEYYAKSTETKGHVVKKYSLPFNLPSLSNAKGEAALGIIVGKLLKPALKKLDPLAETYRTHTIVSTEPLRGAPPPTSLQYMNFESLKEYAREHDFPVDPDDYWDVSHLREDVIDFKTNAADGGIGSKKNVVDRIKERHEERKEEKVLHDMNEGV